MCPNLPASILTFGLRELEALQAAIFEAPRTADEIKSIGRSTKHVHVVAASSFIITFGLMAVAVVIASLDAWFWFAIPMP